MTRIDLNQAPYYDDYNPDKNYSKVVAAPGRVEQAREFTQVQSMIYDYLQRLSDTLLRNGAIIEGMSFNKTGTTMTVESGKVYMEGKVHNFPKQVIEVTNTGEELVGVLLKETLVTEEQDSSLLDPVTSTGNYGQPGAHRIKSEIELVVNDPDASVLYDFFDGDLQSEVPRPQFDGLSQLLAKRTFDESGNYRVNGLEIVSDQYDANNILVTVEAGTAYVQGYQVIKPTPIKNIVPMARDFRSVVGEPKTYVTGTTRYPLNNVPSKAITQVTGHVQVTQNLTRGSSPNGIDYLNNTPVVNVLTVIAGGVTYVRGTDFQLTNDGIDWSPAGKEPATGTSYQVVYQFNKTFVQGTDYRHFQEVGQFGETKDYVDWINGDKPAANTIFYINYDFYLGRVDLISLNKDGQVVVERGQSDVPRNVQAPAPSGSEMLPLGTVYLPPNSGKGKATFNSITRLEMAEIQRMARRVDDIEFNQAISALDREAIEGESTTDLRGIFSDSFRSTVRADLTHTAFTAMYDLESGQIELPIQATQPRDMKISNPANTKTFSKMTTAPMREVLAIRQPFATTTMLINPYLAFNSLGVVDLKPKVDNWIEESFINIEETRFSARQFWRWWRHPSDTWMKTHADVAMNMQSLPGGVQVDENWRPDIGESATVLKTDKSRTILDEAITHMRQIDVEITATNLQPSTDNLECTFDGMRVPLTALPGYSAGSVAGTMRANSSGEIKAKFRVPAGIRTGTREVKIYNATNTAVTSFTSLGTKRTTTDKLITTHITLTAIDPLAQTFQFDKDSMLTSAGVYFSAKDNVHNVIVQVRNVVNGYPGTTIFAEKVLRPSDITVSEDATVETKVTFNDPVVCSSGQQYCIVYLSDSDVHAMYVADLGQNDITDGKKVTRQPYLAGMLFSSSNGLAWTAHQSMNMKFNIYTAEFNSSTTIDFTEQANLAADRLLLIVDTLVPAGTSCQWQVSLDGAPYQAISPYNAIDTLKVVNKVRLRAILNTNGSMSPIIGIEGINLVAFTTGLSGTYVGRNVELPVAITNVKQSFEAHVPSGATVTPQYSYDNGATWRTSTVTSTSPVSAEFTRFTTESTISAGENAKNFRARLNVEANSPLLRPKARKFINIMK